MLKMQAEPLPSVNVSSETNNEIIHTFCRLDDLRSSGRITRWVDELRDEITALIVDGKIIVVSSVCPHFGGEFNFDLKSGHATCKWHGYCFNLRSGNCENIPIQSRLRHYEFRERGDQLEVIAR